MNEPATRPRLEVADILRAHAEAYRAKHPVSPEQAKVMRHLAACRTAALGGHVDYCQGCGFVSGISYNSCRDRHCPKCQSAKQAEWLKARLERLLPVEYFHVVFTLPEQLKPLALKNRRLIYNLLFQAASQTLLELAADPRRLGAQIGFTAVLHTWGQNLLFHPHLHCVVTGGGLSRDGKQWIASRKGYFISVHALAKMFRGKFLAGLKQAYEQGELRLAGSVEWLADRRCFSRLIDSLYRQGWVVYAKPPFGGPQQVYRYLGRYTHRVAISNSRLVALSNGRVRFRYKDYADSDRIKEMTLTADEFLRRFLLHVLPKGFVRIRHYGLLASRNVNTKLDLCRQLLDCQPTDTEPPASSSPVSIESSTETPSTLCPHCQTPLGRIFFQWSGQDHCSIALLASLARPVPILDSS